MKRRVLFILLLSMILAVQVGTVFAAGDIGAETMEQGEAIVTELDAQIESEEDVQVLSSDEVVSGTCGENLTWTLDLPSGVLTISGTGEMDNYYTSSSISTQKPWHSYKNNVNCKCKLDTSW
jgi:hypothetical protein